jgi:hypothetical protein
MRLDQHQSAIGADSRLAGEADALDAYVEALLRGERPPVVSSPLDVRLLVLAVQLRTAGEADVAPDPAFVERLGRRLRAAGMPARWAGYDEHGGRGPRASSRVGRA